MNVKSTPVRFHFAIFGSTAALIGALLWYFLSLDPVWSGLLAANLVAYLMWAWDKRQAKREGFRVPEWTLHLMALFGATPASLIAMQTLRHKTQKKAFTLGYSVLLCAQILAVLLYLRPPSA